jgi:hypothetical protein
VNRRRPHILATSLAVTLFVNARAAAQDARVRDSSGVQIIENSALKDAPIRFKLGDIPFLEVGGIEANRVGSPALASPAAGSQLST